MAELAFYRKYRSADFSQVIGQEHVVKTLTNAISSGRLSHAYLFTGPRGVGKTSVARLLARALNCTGEQKPCNACSLCEAAINSSLDVIEIDAASNRSIDAVRELRERVGIAPAVGKYKIYIIDEVHMLTTEAFNALLKTLEEPPAHAVFVLATTEAHKLPETIISRTQRFSFKPITNDDITGHLRHIAGAENIEVEDAALELIATAARGGFRDAIGMLDQMASSGERPITPAGVRALLGLSDTEAIGAISLAIAAQDAKAATLALTTLLDQGAQSGQVAQQLVNQWREILLVAVGAWSTNDEIIQSLSEQMSPADIGMVVEALLDATRSHWPREALEVAVVRLAVGGGKNALAETAPKAAPTTKTSSKTSGEPKVATDTAPTAPTTAAPAQNPALAPTEVSAELWPKVLVLLKQSNNSLCALLQMYPVDFDSDHITIRSRFNFHRDLFLKPQNRRAIEEVIEKVYGRAVAVTAVTDEAASGQTNRRASRTADPAAELVSSALEILGGEVVE